MNARTSILSALAALALMLPAVSFAARNSADLQPPVKRQSTLAIAEGLATRKAPPPLPADLASPFSPPDFDKPDASELQALNAAAQRSAAAAPRNAPAGAPSRPAPAGDRETLEKLAAQIAPSGMIQLRGTPRLVIGGKPFEVGTRFTATYNSQDYELELVSIDRTTFTLRYRGEEITRPIKPVR